MLWFKSNVQHIIPSDKYQIESFNNGLIHRLTIRDVVLRDDGEYTASTGLNTSQAKLTVEPLMPIFTVPLMDARATTRESVKLSCETSNPCQVVWMHRGKKIIENSYKYIIGNEWSKQIAIDRENSVCISYKNNRKYQKEKCAKF